MYSVYWPLLVIFRPKLFEYLRTSRCDITLSMDWLIHGLIWT